MNRLQFGPLALVEENLNRPTAGSISSVEDSVEDNPRMRTETVAAGLPTKMGQAVYPHSLFIPSGYEKNYSYPLVVYLHDEQQNESMIHQVMSQISYQNYVGASFASPLSPGLKCSWGQCEDVIELSDLALAQCITAVKRRLNINADKVFLAGTGAGGTMAFRLALQNPSLVAGVISINGDLPKALTPFAQLKAARNVPIFWAHYRDSTVFPEASLCSNLSLLHTGGFSITLRQYPNDNVGCRQVFSDSNKWIMEQVTGQSS